jgi:cysteine synthase A
MGPGHTIATLLCDHGSRYQSQLWSAEFRRSRGFPVPSWLGEPTKLTAPLV